MNEVIARLVGQSRNSPEPVFVDALGLDTTAIDPCGMRETNFDMMGSLLPGFNNVGRHIRPFTILAWAWQRALALSQAEKVDPRILRDFVLRTETIFTWSCFLIDDDCDLGGKQAMLPILKSDAYDFAGAAWNEIKDTRQRSTSLAAPQNYRPGLVNFQWAIKQPDRAGIFLPTETATEALAALTDLLGDLAGHPMFNTLDPVSVERTDVERLGAIWNLNTLTEAEKRHMRNQFQTPERKTRIETVLHAARYAGVEDPASDDGVAAVRHVLSGDALGYSPEEQHLDIHAMWNLLQIRQLFRLCMESWLGWMIDRLHTAPMTTPQIASLFLWEAEMDPNVTVGALLANHAGQTTSLASATQSVSSALKQKGRPALAKTLLAAISLVINRSPTEKSREDREDRLPLATAASKVRSMPDASLHELVCHVMEKWILPQHVYWAVGRGLADARGQRPSLMRLKLSMEEGGWRSVPGAVLNPEPTPDRLRTALTLCHEADLI